MTNNEKVKTQKLTAKDFASDQDVRWCPGCGDYSILAQVQRTLPDIIETNKENLVWVSGIGCSSRFPGFRYRLFKPFPILYENFRLSWNPRQSYSYCNRS